MNCRRLDTPVTSFGHGALACLVRGVGGRVIQFTPPIADNLERDPAYARHAYCKVGDGGMSVDWRNPQWQSWQAWNT